MATRPESRKASLIVRSILFLGLFTAISNLWLLHHRTPEPHGVAFQSLLNLSSISCQTIRSVQDIQRCYPSHRFQKPHLNNCSSIETWADVQRCLTGRRRQHANTIRDIRVVGERNSGTKWLVQELQRCFRRDVTGVKAHRDFIRGKHFFQPILQNNHNETTFQQSIVISVFRDPVEWTAAMREMPYHSPRHLHGFDSHGKIVPLPWKDFVETAWTTQRSSLDLQLIRENRIAETSLGDICSQSFAMYEVVPCLYDNANSTHVIPQDRLRGFEPIYELRRDHTGRPFPSILDLRREKIVNFALEIPLLFNLGGYAAVRYEDMVMNGTRYIMEQVARMIGMNSLPEGCNPSLPQPNRIGRRHIPHDFRAYVKEHIDQQVERLLGN
jgi:hypothetical protein